MSKICQVTGKKPMSGNHVSHANNKVKRRFMPNLHKLRFWSESRKCFFSLTVSAKGLRIINKKGLDSVLTNIITS